MQEQSPDLTEGEVKFIPKLTAHHLLPFAGHNNFHIFVN